MRAFWKLVAIVIIAAASGAGATLALHFIKVSGATAVDVSYSDFLSITLTALSLMITVLGLFVAASGLIGWSTIESKLRSHSLDYFTKQLSKEGPLRKELEELFSSIAYTGIEGLKAPEKDEEGPYSD